MSAKLSETSNLTHSAQQNGLKTSSCALEEYIVQLQNRDTKEQNIIQKVNEASVADLRLQLEEKDKDLVLAAKLGKALLERNEDLTRTNERITEEYSHKLEILEQEKHELRRKLDTLESEYDGRVSEYQTDLQNLKQELSEQQNFLKQTEREKIKMVQELMEQNHRLTNELKESAESEERLSNQLLSLKEKVNTRRSNLNDHVAQVDGLREEIQLLSKRKNDLEKRMNALIEEREGMALSLEESADRILVLEKSEQDLEIKVSNLMKELDESKQINEQLQSKLIVNDSLTPNSSPVINGNGPFTSLYTEIEMSSSSSFDEDLRSLNGNSSNDHRDSDFEDKDWKFRQEMIEVYQALRRLCSDIQRRKEHSGNFNSTTDSGVPSTPEEMHTNDLRPGMLIAVTKVFSSLLAELNDIPCISCQTMASERLELEKLKKETAEKEEEIKRKNEEAINLTTKVAILETELSAAKEERDNLKESMNVDGMGKDEIVKRAWELRDQAVARKNTVEIELAKTRIECMHVNSQLMEAIQQKITLSEQIDQWQLDMQNLLDEQLKEKLSNQEQEAKRKSESKPTSVVITTPGLIKRAKMLRLWKR